MSKSLPTFQSALGRWLPIALIGIGLILFTQLAVQQNYRQSANDPQIQMAEDAAAALDQGANPASLVPVQKVDREHSLAPFLIIIDKQQQIVATNASTDSDSPLPPPGVFHDVDVHGEQRFSWQTAQGTRFAAVVAPASTGYVVAARSLKEVEVREHNLTAMAAATALGALIVTLLAALVVR